MIYVKLIVENMKENLLRNFLPQMRNFLNSVGLWSITWMNGKRGKERIEEKHVCLIKVGA